MNMGNLTSETFSSKTTEWETPKEFFDRLNKEFQFTLDPWASDTNTKCSKYYTKEQNGLNQDWSKEIVFVNPPYGRDLVRWLKKGMSEVERGATVVLLIPARTNTRWWREIVMEASEIRFVTGRLKFGNAKHGLPFPLALVIFKAKNLYPFLKVSTFDAYAVNRHSAQSGEVRRNESSWQDSKNH
jgi:site-specific DNA-methyltransferase (adenine-specific)